MGEGGPLAVDEVSHAQSLTDYSSVFCSAKSTFPHKGRLCVPEPAGETAPHSGERLSKPPSEREVAPKVTEGACVLFRG